MQMTDGSSVNLDSSRIISAPEKALFLLSLTMVGFLGKPGGFPAVTPLTGEPGRDALVR